MTTPMAGRDAMTDEPPNPEHLQLAKDKDDHDGAQQEGPYQEGDQQGYPHHEEGAQEARQVPNLKPSLSKGQNLTDGNQGDKEGRVGWTRDGHVEKQQGGAHNVDQLQGRAKELEDDYQITTAVIS